MPEYYKKLLISKLPASMPKTKAAKCKTSCQVPVGEKVLNPCSYKFMCKVNNQQLLSICVRTSHDIYVFKSNEYFVGLNPANFKVNTFLLELDNYLNWIFVNQYLIKYGIESIFQNSNFDLLCFGHRSIMASQESHRVLQGLARYCWANTTFTFHVSIWHSQMLS